MLQRARSFHFLLIAGLTVAAVSLADAQGILKNKGTFTNSGSATYKEVQNYKTGTGGTIVNSGTITTSTAGGGSGNFLNQAGGGDGTVRNFSGATHGTLVVVNNLDNNSAGASIDNDNAGVGVIRVAGSFTNAGTVDTDSGKVEYYGAGAQSIVPLTYGALVASVGGTKTMSGTVVVRDTMRITTSATFAFNSTSDSLAVIATNLTNNGTFTASNGKVNYGADGNQSLFASTSYYRLYTSGAAAARTKTYTGNLAFAASGYLSVGANDTLSVTGNLDLATNSPDLYNSAAAAAIKMGGDATFQGGIVDAGTFYYAGTGTQTIGSVTYTDLRLGNSGAKNFPNATVGILGNYTLDSGVGARDYTSAGSSAALAFQGTSGTQTVSNLSGEALNILQFSGAAAKNFSGISLTGNLFDILGTSGTVTSNLSGTFTLSSISGTSMSVATGATFVNSATSTISMSGDMSNDGTITNAGTISVF